MTAPMPDPSLTAPDHDPTRACPRCGGTNGTHGHVHERYGNGGGGNRPCPNTFVEAFREERPSAPSQAAPIDSSAIKAGDTVEAVHEDGDMIASVVKAYAPLHPVYGAQMPVITTQAGFEIPIGIRGAWTLTAHHPAPEPKCAPGTLAEATVRGVEGVRVLRLDKPAPQPQWWSVTHREVLGTSLHHTRQVTDVRPLSVIDPAALREAIVNAFQVEDNVTKADAVLAELGLAVTR